MFSTSDDDATDTNDTLFDISSIPSTLSEEERTAILEKNAPEYIGFKRELELKWQEVEKMEPLIKATMDDDDNSLKDTKYLSRAVHYIHLKYRKWWWCWCWVAFSVKNLSSKKLI